MTKRTGLSFGGDFWNSWLAVDVTTTVISGNYLDQAHYSLPP